MTNILSGPQRIDDHFIEDMRKLMDEEQLWKEEKRYNDGTVTYTRQLPNVDEKLKAIKVVTEMNCDLKTASNLLYDKSVERFKDWNKSFVDGKYVERFNDDENVQWWRFSQGLMDDRDFLIARKRISHDDCVLIIDRSVLREDLPPLKGVIRADLPFQVRCFKTLAPHRIKFTYMNMTDLKGKIPTWLSNWTNPSYSAEEMFRIKEICQKEDTSTQA